MKVSLHAYCASLASYLTSVKLNFLICKTGVIIIHTSLGYCEVNELMNAKQGRKLLVVSASDHELCLFLHIQEPGCGGPASAGSRGTRRMNGVSERDRDRDRDRETRLGVCSRVCFIFYHSFYILS